FSSRRRHTRFSRDWSSDVCSSDLTAAGQVYRRVVPYRGTVLHGVVVDMQDALEIGFLGVTYQHIEILLNGQGCIGAEDIDPFPPNWLIGTGNRACPGLLAVGFG